MVSIDRWHGAVRLRFDDPGHRNPLTLATVEQLREALAKDPAETVLLGSTDPQAFSAGADIHAGNQDRTRISELIYECLELMVTRPGLVVAVVEGVAVGGGAQVGTAADIRICGPGARWRWVGLGHGLAVGGWALPSLVGRGRALDLIVTSRWVDAAEAARWGLCNDISDVPWTAAAALLDHISTLDPHAVSRLKQLSRQTDPLSALRLERDGNREWNGHVGDPPVSTIRHVNK